MTILFFISVVNKKDYLRKLSSTTELRDNKSETQVHYLISLEDNFID